MSGTKSEARLHVFGSACHLVIGGGNELLDAARNELLRLEQKFSSYNPESIICSINQCAGTGSYTPLDAETRSLLEYVTALWDRSNHVFDPCTCLLQSCFAPDGKPQASRKQLQGMLKLVDWSALEISEEGARLPTRGMLIDLNSCIRPYAVDCVRRLLAGSGVQHALIEMDRDIASIGKQSDGSNWLVGVKHPRGALKAITRLKLNDRGFAMRGNFERRVTIDGEHFGRALSPVDGQPVPGLLSVAVVAENCLTACGAATVARLKTEQAAINWLTTLGLPWMAIDRQLNCQGPLAPR
jgi:FAD:protein FMN transferase